MAKNPHAVALGSMKSEKKAAAARMNAKKGGWPKGRPRKPKAPRAGEAGEGDQS